MYTFTRTCICFFVVIVCVEVGKAVAFSTCSNDAFLSNNLIAEGDCYSGYLSHWFGAVDETWICDDSSLLPDGTVPIVTKGSNLGPHCCFILKLLQEVTQLIKQSS